MRLPLILTIILQRVFLIQELPAGACLPDALDVYQNVVSELERLSKRFPPGMKYKVAFDTVTVTGTENIMMAASLAEGETVLENAAREPEIVDLANALIRMGAKIEGAGTDIIRIEGVEKLRALDYSVMPDRIETGTFVIAAAITNGSVTIKNCVPGHLEAVLAKVTEAGARVTSDDGTIHVAGHRTIKPVNVTTLEYPGFPTDMQAQIMSLVSIAEGTSVINETIFENRFTHVAELRRMGADIRTDGRTAIINSSRSVTAASAAAVDHASSDGALIPLMSLRSSSATRVMS